MSQGGTAPMRLLADVGATHVRFASQGGAAEPLQHVARYVCRDFDTLADAIFYHLHREGLPRPRSCAIGIATAVTGDHVRMTNHHWSFSTRALQSALGAERVLVINDFTALALALPVLGPQSMRKVGGGEPVAGAAKGLVGPGTGLGVSGLLRSDDGATQVAVGGEGGHATLSSYEPEERAVLEDPEVLDLAWDERGFRPLDLFEHVDDGLMHAYTQPRDLPSVWVATRRVGSVVALFNWTDADASRRAPDGTTLTVPAHGVRIIRQER